MKRLTRHKAAIASWSKASIAIATRRWLTVVLSIVMVLNMVPVTAAADEPSFGAGEEGAALETFTDSIIVTAFDELPDELRWQNTMTPELPATISGIVEEESAQIPVIWEADHSFNADFPARGLYVFTAVPDEGYAIAPGVEAPRITVYIPQSADSMLMRMEGNGTDTSPLGIFTAAQLAEIAALVNTGKLESVILGNASAKVYLQLANDIDLSVYNSNGGWTPIGTNTKPFKGIFDGGGNKITGLVINRPGSDNQGLFGVIDFGGAVQNLGLANVKVAGKRYVGGVAGDVVGTVQNCYVTGSVSGVNTIGGVAGYIDETNNGNGTVQNCYASVSVRGTGNYIGGIAGYVDGTVKNSSTFGSISGNSDIGGVAGHVTGYGTLQNCYAAGNVSGIFSVGGIAGSIYGTLQNCAALNPVISGSMDVGRVTGDSRGDLSDNVAFSGIPGTWSDDFADGFDGESRTAEEISAAGFFEALFGNDAVWTYAIGKLPGLFGAAVDLPDHIVDKNGAEFLGSGTEQAPYQIRTASELATLAELVNAGTAPYANVAKYYELMRDIDLSGYVDNGGWEPIGTDDNPFRGRFNGGGKVISNMHINRSGISYQGLFGNINSGTVHNLGVANVNIKGGNFIGGIAGNMENSTVQNSFVTGIVSGIFSIGGVAGNAINSIIQSCYSSVSVSGTGDIGGVAGKITDGIVQNCYSAANVSGEGNEVGGMVGSIIDEGKVQHVYAVGNISGGAYVGGVAGSISSQGMLKNSVALNASVSGTSNIGRVAGYKMPGAVLAGNLAFSAMPGVWNDLDADRLNGADVFLTQIYAAAFWTTAGNWDTSGWDSNVWMIEDGKLPILKNVGGTQSGDGGPYLTMRDIAHAAVQVTGSYTYTGSPVRPTITVAFDGKTLAAGVDYTVSDKRNTEAGNSAVLTVQGIGNFTGTQDVVFIIQKAAGPAAPAVNGSSVVDNSTDTYTYTVDAIIGAEYRMDGGEWQDSNVFAGIAPTSSHTFFARIKETANVEAGAAGETGTVVFDNLNQSAPQAFSLIYASVDDESYTVTIPATAGAEYSFDGIAWSSNNSIEDVTPGATITGYKRVAARAGYNASPATSDSVTLPLLQVKSPTASPAGGMFIGSQIVTLSSATAGADIYYTTDGTAPTTGSTPYTAPFTLRATATIKAIAVKSGMADSDVLSMTFTKQSTGGGGSSGGGSDEGNPKPDMDEKDGADRLLPDKPTIDLNGTPLDPAGIDLTKPSVTLEAGLQNGTAYVGIPASILASFAAKNASFYIEIKTPYGSYRIPVNLASLIPEWKELLAKHNLQVGDISFKITLTDKSGNKALQAVLEKGLPNGKVLGAMVDYHLEIVKTKTGQSLGKVDTFSKAITRIIPLLKPMSAMPTQWGAFSYNEVAGKWGFVPARAVKMGGGDGKDGVWVVVINSYSNSTYMVADNATSFVDVQKHWAKSSIELVAAKGLVSGVGNDRYHPDKAVTRAEFAAMLVRALGRGASASDAASYGDVGADAWYAGEVATAKAMGLLDFAGGASFNPNQALTREEMGSMLAAAIRLEQPKAASEAANLDRYNDIGSVDASYLESIRLLVKLQIMVGTSEDAFSPKSVTTRAQASIVFIRMLRQLGMID
ncbi:S-layer homology domain-containing protein [Paenibacillus sp. GCM10012307]|uniref:S-layer homology domain-containing protein n=1 Tax=Paenibacillus roseus TaxID=2798579 RepID=A0A934J8R7_9BACL|nr:S-layer homology domain-containing protein [Paenibacillus roseus]MBJ6362512.1 S-layer homology domain-containing protein [Paenibacillus roseus]